MSNGPSIIDDIYPFGLMEEVFDHLDEVRVNNGVKGEEEVESSQSMSPRVRVVAVQRSLRARLEEKESVPGVSGEHHSLNAVARGSARALSAIDINGFVLE
jgi:hypothetical protein